MNRCSRHGTQRKHVKTVDTKTKGREWASAPAPPLMRSTPDLQRTRDFRDFEDFELIAFDDIVEVLHRHTALEALTHFLDIVLEALERIELASVDDDVVAQHAHRRRTLDHAIRDHTACHGAD